MNSQPYIPNSQHIRPVVSTSRGMPTSDGAGVRMTRMIGTPELDHMDPFLLFDVFRSDNPNDYIAGFPSHPHRGFETVTYMFAGNMRHKDNAGHEGLIRAGGVQWMTAGRGIVHSEMPEQKDGLMWGTQLWINLPASEKMCKPGYAEFDAENVPLETRDELVNLKVVAGQTSRGTAGAVAGRPTQPLYLDISLQEQGVFNEPLPDTQGAFVFVIEGSVEIGTESATQPPLTAGTLAILGKANSPEALISIHGIGQQNRVLLIAANEINEPIARGGPFVMNTVEELHQAFRDYQAGRF